MCGRYLIEVEVYADIGTILANIAAESSLARGEVFPTNIAPVITLDGAVAAKWGFPKWKGAGVIINARAETALEKNMFRKPLLERRCVIPSSGFFEWDHGGANASLGAKVNMGTYISEGAVAGANASMGVSFGDFAGASPGAETAAKKKKDKYLLRLPGERLLYMAGMASRFRDAAGIEYGAFVILTTAATGSTASIHDRMPLILAPDERDRWINDAGFMEHALRRAGPELALELVS